jgi:hypothetical protein
MSDDLVTVASFGTTFEANLAKGELEANEIDAVLKDDNMVNVNPLLTNFLGGVKLQVAASDEEEARSILKQGAI